MGLYLSMTSLPDSRYSKARLALLYALMCLAILSLALQMSLPATVFSLLLLAFRHYLGSVSTLLPLKQNPHFGSKQQSFISQGQPKSFQGIIGLTLPQFQLLRSHGHQPQPLDISKLKRWRHENPHVLWGYCLPSIRIFIIIKM